MNASRPTSPLDLDRAILEAMSRGTIPIPAYPAVALQLQEIVGRPEFGLDEVSRAVGSDPTLAAGVLRCANSALYGRGAPVTALGPAIIRIGASEVTRIALTATLESQAQAPGALALLRRGAWIESLGSAVLCQELARRRGLSAEDAFICGLLHDFGKVVVTACVESVLARHPGAAPRSREAWAALAERYHVEVGLAVASRWRLPDVVREVIALHHGDDPASAGAAEILRVVRACDGVVALLGRRPGLEELALAEVPDLAAAERAALAALAEQIPSFVASLERAAHGAAVPPSMVSGVSAPEPGSRRVSFGVVASVGGRSRPLAAVAMTPNALVATGPEGLPEGRLLEFSLQCRPGPFSIWATVERCRPEGAGFRAEIRPFALSAGARSRWSEVLREGAPA